MRKRPASLVEAGQKETPYNAKLKACCAGRTSFNSVLPGTRKLYVNLSKNFLNLSTAEDKSSRACSEVKSFVDNKSFICFLIFSNSNMSSLELFMYQY